MVASLQQHLDALLAQSLPAVPLDEALVAKARTTFSRVSLASRAYSRIKPSAAALNLPPWRPSDAIGRAGEVLGCLTLLRCSEESRHVFFSQAERGRQGRPRRVVSIQAEDARIVGTRERFLGLDDFDGVGDSGAETVARLRQLFVRERDGARRQTHLPLCRIDVEERRNGAVSIKVHVSPGDMGRVIGKRGRVAHAIRTVVRAAAARDGVDADVDFVD